MSPSKLPNTKISSMESFAHARIFGHPWTTGQTSKSTTLSSLSMRYIFDCSGMYPSKYLFIYQHGKLATCAPHIPFINILKKNDDAALKTLLEKLEH